MAKESTAPSDDNQTSPLTSKNEQPCITRHLTKINNTRQSLRNIAPIL